MYPHKSASKGVGWGGVGVVVVDRERRRESISRHDALRGAAGLRLLPSSELTGEQPTADRQY